MSELTFHEKEQNDYHPRIINLSAGVVLGMIVVFLIKELSAADIGFLSMAGLISVFTVLVKSNSARDIINFILGISFLAVFCILFSLLVFSSTIPFAIFTGLKTKYLILYLFFSILFFYNSSRSLK